MLGKTFREIAARRDHPASKKSKLRRLFGKLELRYTRTHCHVRLGNSVTVTRYTIVAKDASSVATFRNPAPRLESNRGLRLERSRTPPY